MVQCTRYTHNLMYNLSVHRVFLEEKDNCAVTGQSIMKKKQGTKKNKLSI